MTRLQQQDFIQALLNFKEAAYKLTSIWSESDMTDEEVDATAGIPVGMSFDEFYHELANYTEGAIVKLRQVGLAGFEDEV